MNSNPITSLRAVAIMTLTMALTGCLAGGNSGSTNTNNTNSVPVEDRSTAGNHNNSNNSAQHKGSATPAAPQPTQAELGKNKVTLALLNKSEVARSQGNLTEAVTHVERAIRINPRRADLWVQLAQLQLALEEPTIAEGYARKAISLAGSRLDWKRNAWLVIADAKQAQGLTAEADAIRQRWRTAQG